MSEKEKLEKKIASINQWQFLCFLPGVIFAFTGRSKAIDAAHAQNAALFRLCVILLGLAIFVTLQIVKSGCKKRIRVLESVTTNVQPPIPPPF
ncbi:MAG TPA: hypothetical protein VM821_05490 [Abditibacteriaceae bacterium]|jgi:hypothetical protein|nr:hypothetical protein [Abditibacteriaceae bacterium]